MFKDVKKWKSSFWSISPPFSFHYTYIQMLYIYLSYAYIKVWFYKIIFINEPNYWLDIFKVKIIFVHKNSKGFTKSQANTLLYHYSFTADILQDWLNTK